MYDIEAIMDTIPSALVDTDSSPQAAVRRTSDFDASYQMHLGESIRKAVRPTWSGIE